MTIRATEREINRFLSDENPAILCIKGLWGVGKTYAWNDATKKYFTDRNTAMKRYSYTSLFGIKDLDQLKISIFQNTVQGDFLQSGPTIDSLQAFISTTEKTLRASSPTLTRIFAKLPFVKYATDMIASITFMAVRNQIVCFDDLERMGSSLALKDVFGLAVMLKEQRKCKVAIIMNDDQLSEKDDFQKYFEKVIDKSVVYAPSPVDCAAIALNLNDQTEALIYQHVSCLKITNIRIILKIRAFVEMIRPKFFPKYSESFNEAVKTLCVLCWIQFLPSEAPPLKFLVDRVTNRLIRGTSENELPDDEARWNQILDKIPFSYMDELDNILLGGIKNGYFDEESMDTILEDSEKRVRNIELRANFTRAWDLYHNTLDDNTAQLVGELEVAFYNAAKLIEPTNVDSTIVLFKYLGFVCRADAMIQHYLSLWTADDLRQMQEDIFLIDLKDPSFIKAIKNKMDHDLRVRLDIDVLREVARGVISARNAEHLAKISVVNLKDTIKLLVGREITKAIRNCYRLKHEGPDGIEVARRMREVVDIIAAENPLNADRMRKYQT